MMLGLLVLATVVATVASAALYLLSAPLWLVLVAYPLAGIAVLLAGLALAHVRHRHCEGKPAILSRVTGRFRAGQRPR